MKKCFVYKREFPGLTPWDKNKAYDFDVFVSFGGDVFRSSQDANQGNSPDDSPNHWTMQRDFSIDYPNYWQREKHTREAWLRMIGAAVLAESADQPLEVAEGEEDQFAEAVARAHLELRGVVAVKEIDLASLPPSLTDRNAWKHEGNRIVMDDAKKKRIEDIKEKHKSKK